MGVISMVGKIVLVVTNILILLLSIIMIVLGIIVVAGKDVYNSLLSDLDTQLKAALGNLGVTVSTDNLSISDFVMPLAYGLIGLGIVMGAISLIGCCGACYTVKIILIVYAIIVAAILLVQVVIITLVYADKAAFDSAVKPSIKDTLSSYSGIEGTDANSLAWNALMNYEGCCGVDDYNDFPPLTNWPPATINGVPYTLVTPVICCISKTTSYTCATAPTDSTNYWKTGCYDKLWDLILNNALVVTIIIFLVVAQAVLLFFTIWILCTMNNKIDII